MTEADTAGAPLPVYESGTVTVKFDFGGSTPLSYLPGNGACGFHTGSSSSVTSSFRIGQSASGSPKLWSRR